MCAWYIYTLPTLFYVHRHNTIFTKNVNKLIAFNLRKNETLLFPLWRKKALVIVTFLVHTILYAQRERHFPIVRQSARD